MVSEFDRGKGRVTFATSAFAMGFGQGEGEGEREGGRRGGGSGPLKVFAS